MDYYVQDDFHSKAFFVERKIDETIDLYNDYLMTLKDKIQSGVDPKKAGELTNMHAITGDEFKWDIRID